jgi:hypothetical protein
MTREERNRRKRESYKKYYHATKGTPQHEIRKKRQRELASRNYAKNPEKVKAQRRAEWRANPMKMRERRYKLKIIRSAPENCEACGTPFKTTHHGACLDHDHKTNLHRGWLCHHCNNALGYAKDSRDRLQLLINYLDRVELLS